MALILNGTNGLSDVDGSAATPAIRGSDANTGVFFGTDIVGVSTGGSERMRVDASGNVGIGTSSPDANLTVNGAASFAAGTALLPSITSAGDLNTGIFFPAADTIAFAEGGVEAARFDSGGRFGIGITPSTVVPTSLQYSRVGRRHMASGGMSGATWVNTGITFTASNSYCFILVDALGNENGRNNGFRRYILFYNIYSGWSTTGAIINNQHGNDYGLVDVRYTSTLEVKATNNVSGGPYFIYATEYLL